MDYLRSKILANKTGLGCLLLCVVFLIVTAIDRLITQTTTTDNQGLQRWHGWIVGAIFTCCSAIFIFISGQQLI